MNYSVIGWQDHETEYSDRYTETTNSDGTITHTKVEGEVIEEGTPMSATNFGKMDGGILQNAIVHAMMLNAFRQLGWRTEDLEKATVQETGSKTLTNTGKFLNNNSQVSAALQNVRDNLNYVVVIISVEGSGNIGEIEIKDRQVNGFKIGFTGSAKSATVTYAVIGGYD